MTKQEALDKIKELEDYIKELDNMKIGFENDEVFLLSKEEYKKYRDMIPPCSIGWWLRSPGGNSDCAMGVNSTGAPNTNGNCVEYINAVRPAIHYPNISLQNGDRIMRFAYPWIVIDSEKHIAIAETPIAFYRFDTKGNDYKNSIIRKFLLDWIESR